MYTIARKTPLALYLRWQIRSTFTVLREKARILFAQENNASAAQREDINAQAAHILDAYGNNILELIDEQREDLSFVWEAVKALPVKYREVIHLFYHEGYSTAEIAGILQMKEATVRSNLSRGREQLKSVLKEAYDFG